MDFAVVRISGKQYLAQVGQKLEVEGNLGETDQKISHEEVLLAVIGETVKVGTPLVEEIAVSSKVIKNGKGNKIRVAKFKAKSRYRRVMGFRPLITTLEVTEIGGQVASKAKKKV